VDFFHDDFLIFLFFEMQIPLYPATIFQSENDGEGMNVVLYFKLSEKYSKDLSDQFRENITVSCRICSCLCLFNSIILPHNVTEDDASITLWLICRHFINKCVCSFVF
jgi:hypothetical protein